MYWYDSIKKEDKERLFGYHYQIVMLSGIYFITCDNNRLESCYKWGVHFWSCRSVLYNDAYAFDYYKKIVLMNLMNKCSIIWYHNTTTLCIHVPSILMLNAFQFCPSYRPVFQEIRHAGNLQTTSRRSSGGVGKHWHSNSGFYFN